MPRKWNITKQRKDQATHLVDGPDVDVACVDVLVVDVAHALGQCLVAQPAAAQQRLRLIQRPPHKVLPIMWLAVCLGSDLVHVDQSSE